MFPFNQEDYRSMIRALQIVHSEYPKLRVLWKVVKVEGVEMEELPYARQVGWLDSIDEVYEHPSVKVVIHHGGGNSILVSLRLLHTESDILTVTFPQT